jgi:hypothetical protein
VSFLCLQPYPITRIQIASMNFIELLSICYKNTPLDQA